MKRVRGRVPQAMALTVDEAPRALAAARQKEGMAEGAFFVLRVGETRRITH